MYLLCKRQEWKISHNEQRSIVRANRDARLDENATVALLSVLPPRSLNTQMKRAEEITRIITIIDFFFNSGRREPQFLSIFVDLMHIND